MLWEYCFSYSLCVAVVFVSWLSKYNMLISQIQRYWWVYLSTLDMDQLSCFPCLQSLLTHFSGVFIHRYAVAACCLARVVSCSLTSLFIGCMSPTMGDSVAIALLH